MENVTIQENPKMENVTIQENPKMENTPLQEMCKLGFVGKTRIQNHKTNYNFHSTTFFKIIKRLNQMWIIGTIPTIQLSLT